MTRELLTGNAAAAWGARLAEVDYVPVYPITPQTEVIETLAQWTSSGELKARLVTMDSEHSMLTAAGNVVPSHLLDHRLFDFSRLRATTGDIESELDLAVGHTDEELEPALISIG